jgi:hypothetical protein
MWEATIRALSMDTHKLEATKTITASAKLECCPWTPTILKTLSEVHNGDRSAPKGPPAPASLWKIIIQKFFRPTVRSVLPTLTSGSKNKNYFAHSTSMSSMFKRKTSIIPTSCTPKTTHISNGSSSPPS